MSWFRWVFPFSWLALIEPPGHRRSESATYTALTLVFVACFETLHILPVIPFLTAQLHFGAFLMVAVAVALVGDVGLELGMPERLSLRTWAVATGANRLFLLGALLLGGLTMVDGEEGFRQLIPLDLPGCRWVRVTERDAAYYTFLTQNVRKSSDCVFARFGLESLHFWAQQPPCSDVVPISNLWLQMDRLSDKRLLEAHESCPRMIFIDNPHPWNPVVPKLEFLDFIAKNFKVLARLGSTRLLIRQERKDLELFDCAFQPRATDGEAPVPVLWLRLSDVLKLQDVATIELVDLDKQPPDQFLASTSGPPAERLALADAAGRQLLPAAAVPIEIPGKDESVRLSLPATTDLRKVGFPALRFLAADGRRLSTLPVAIDADDSMTHF